MDSNTDSTNLCLICENNIKFNEYICSYCGYDLNNDMINDDKLKKYYRYFKQNKNWQKYIFLIKNFNDYNIRKKGLPSTKPDCGWSQRKTAKYFSENHVTIWKCINVAENAISNPGILNLSNITTAYQWINQRCKGNIQDKYYFSTESSLQNYISQNWEQLFEDWVLVNKTMLSKGKYDTRDIGEMDFLAKNIKLPKWLVIELKKDQTSDSTVGQILRYMGWVKYHLAKEDDIVEGLIIAGNEDKAIQYALECTKYISFKTYKYINGKLSLNSPKPLIQAWVENLSREERLKLLESLS